MCFARISSNCNSLNDESGKVANAETERRQGKEDGDSFPPRRIAKDITQESRLRLKNLHPRGQIHHLRFIISEDLGMLMNGQEKSKREGLTMRSRRSIANARVIYKNLTEKKLQNELID